MGSDILYFLGFPGVKALALCNKPRKNRAYISSEQIVQGGAYFSSSSRAVLCTK